MYPANKAFLAAALPAALIGGTILWEGTEYRAYKDIVGVSTVCHGHTGNDIIQNKLYTKKECEALLTKDLYKHAKGMLECTNVPLNVNQFVAFTMFTYNVGVGNFCSSTLVKKLNSRDYIGACDQLLRWDFANGKRIKGLTNRRGFEHAICISAPTPLAN